MLLSKINFRFLFWVCGLPPPTFLTIVWNFFLSFSEGIPYIEEVNFLESGDGDEDEGAEEELEELTPPAETQAQEEGEFELKI